MPIYDAPGGNEVTSPNPAVVIVDKDGVPQSLGGGPGGGGLTQNQTRDAVRDGVDASLDVEDIKTTLSTRLALGTPITGETLEAGGGGFAGWVSSLRKAITDRLPASLGQRPPSQSLSTVIALHSISRYRNTSLSATRQEIKATAGDIYGWNFINTNTVDVFVKFYNGAAAAVTVGTTAPVLTLLVPAGNSAGAGLFFQEVGEQPQERFADGITVACVTGIGDNSTAAPSTPIHASVRFI